MVYNETMAEGTTVTEAEIGAASSKLPENKTSLGRQAYRSPVTGR